MVSRCLRASRLVNRVDFKYIFVGLCETRPPFSKRPRRGVAKQEQINKTPRSRCISNDGRRVVHEKYGRTLRACINVNAELSTSMNVHYRIFGIRFGDFLGEFLCNARALVAAIVFGANPLVFERISVNFVTGFHGFNFCFKQVIEFGVRVEGNFRKYFCGRLCIGRALTRGKRSNVFKRHTWSALTTGGAD